MNTTTTGNKDVDEAYAGASRRHAPSIEYPQLSLRVHIVGTCFIEGAVQLLAKAGCTAAKGLPDAELVVFLGGADIDPQLYGEKALGCTSFSVSSDTRDVAAFTEALHLGIPMFGICRGMQFLHAMNGGTLYQDVANHTRTHNIIDTDGQIIRASSMHHQMCIEDDNTIPLAYAEQKGLGSHYLTYAKHTTDPTHDDLEAAVYPDINAIAVQGHPEVGGYPEYSAWCLTQIDQFMNEKRMIGHNRPTYVLGDKGKAALKIDADRVPQSIITNV